MGFDTFNVGPELEYFLFEDDKGTKTLDEGGYFAMTAQDAATEVRNDTIARARVGRDPDRVPPPRGRRRRSTRSTCATPTRSRWPTRRITYRLIVKEVAAWHGYYATFMPKPLFGENGSGMHTHMSLFKGGRNQFFDAKDPHHLSKTAKAFIAGLLVHAREMSAVLAQWVNSYKRLVPGLRGAGLRRLVAAEPLGADPDPALQAGRRSRRRAPRSAARIRPATRTSRSRRCSMRGSRGSRRATSCPTR